MQILPTSFSEKQMKAFKDILIHDITAKEFSDIYAQLLLTEDALQHACTTTFIR